MIKFDAASIKERLQNKLRSKNSWANILFYSTNQRLIDSVAEEFAYDMQMNEIYSVECKWNLAQQITSLMAQTQFFNYYPSRKIGASGLLKVSTSKTFDSLYALTIQIDKYSMFATESGINFCVSETTNLSNNDNYINVNIVQGTAKSLSFIALGNDFEVITILNSNIENNIFDVYINGDLWTNVLNIRDAEDGYDKVYTISNLLDFSGIELSFGDDNFGKKLVSGDVVLFKYVETNGVDGNITSSNIITTVVSTFTDVNGSVVDLYCTNVDEITGGVNEEDIETIRAKAPKTYQAGDRAVTKSDYKSIVESFSFIQKANVWGESEVNEDLGNIPGTYIAAEENVVHISTISSSYDNITSEQELTIRTELNEKKPPTDIVVFEQTLFIYINFNVQAYVLDKKYVLSVVKNSILTTLQSDYSLDKLNYLQTIRFSDYVSKIDLVTGVDYHETTLSYYKYEYFTSAYVSPISIYMGDLKQSSIKISIKEKQSLGNFIQVAHDDGSGNLVADSGYTVAGSYINYETGVGNITITSGLTESYNLYQIKVAFETTVDNIIPTKRYQIISYGSSTINCTYE